MLPTTSVISRNTMLCWNHHVRMIFVCLAFSTLLVHVHGLARENTRPDRITRSIGQESTPLHQRKRFSASQGNTDYSNDSPSFLSRRECLAATLIPMVLGGSSTTAVAATPVTPKEIDSLGAMAKRKFLRAKPPKVLRRKLSQDFAVLLMRSSYNALDTLDCVPMVGTSEM